MANITARAFHARNFKSTAGESLLIDNTVGGIALTPAVYGAAKYALITVEIANIRVTADGSPPNNTTRNGHIVKPVDTIEIDSAEDIAAFRALRAGAVNAHIYATYSDIKLT